MKLFHFDMLKASELLAWLLVSLSVLRLIQAAAMIRSPWDAAGPFLFAAALFVAVSFSKNHKGFVYVPPV